MVYRFTQINQNTQLGRFLYEKLTRIKKKEQEILDIYVFTFAPLLPSLLACRYFAPQEQCTEREEKIDRFRSIASRALINNKQHCTRAIEPEINPKRTFTPSSFFLCLSLCLCMLCVCVCLTFFSSYSFILDVPKIVCVCAA